MQTRDQRYATTAYEHVKLVKGQDGDKQYGSMAHKLPILIHTAGLAQALTFVEARVTKKTPRKILVHLAETVLGETDEQILLNKSRTAPLGEYMLLTQQVLAALLWYKRFAQSILKVEASDSDDTEALHE
jgi:CRISPR-associated protein Cmr5